MNDIKYFTTTIVASYKLPEYLLLLMLFYYFWWPVAYGPKERKLFTASINMSFTTYNSLKCLPCCVGDNKMLCSPKFHPRLLGNPNMLHRPNDHIVYQSGFHSHNQSRVHLLFGSTGDKLGPHIFCNHFF